jgi:hypothetical protein
MNTTIKLTAAAACALTLTACGGAGNSGPSIAACFTAPNTINYAWTWSVSAGSPGLVYPVSQSVGPATLNGKTISVNGQPVVQTITTMSDESTSPLYWTTENSNVIFFLEVNPDGTTSADTPIQTIPLDMQPDQSVTVNESDPPQQLTFTGFETLTLAGKTFSNVCHFTSNTYVAGVGNATDDTWYAAGYGLIQEILFAPPQNYTVTQAYNGDLLN